MIISYHFSFDDGREMSFNVDLDRHYDAAKAKKAASWTALDNNKCQNCPLSSSDHQHCPAAFDRHLPQARAADKNGGGRLHEGLRSLGDGLRLDEPPNRNLCIEQYSHDV